MTRASWVGSALGLAVAFAFVSTACGSDDDESGGPASEFYRRYADVYCTGMAPCCAARGKPNDVDACKQIFGLVGARGTSGTRYDASAGEQCLAELNAWVAGCGTVSGEPGLFVPSPSPEPCGRALIGARQPAEACQQTFDCAQPAEGVATCRYAPPANEGTCKVSPPPAEGQPCGDATETATVFYTCGFGSHDFYCDDQTKTCKKRPAVGAPCTASIGCASGASCDLGGAQCVADVPVGGDCSTRSCVLITYCDAVTHQCAGKKPLGEACTSSAECDGECDLGKCTRAGFVSCQKGV